MPHYFRPLLQSGPARPVDAISLAGGWSWFTHLERLNRQEPPQVIRAQDAPDALLHRLASPRPDIAGLSFDRPRIMGILNVTPDSFSDGGKHQNLEAAVAAARAMQGADMIDVGGESTRPGAKEVSIEDEIRRTRPVIGALCDALSLPISIDTRKAPVAKAALDAGALLVNDVSGFTFDEALAPLCAERGVPVCVMHAQGAPETMQAGPVYDDVLLDVFDFLASQIDRLEAMGISRNRIIADPGIGFGKTLEHNLALLSRLSLFHGLGVPLLLGASRKAFIGRISGVEQPTDRVPGSLGVALAAVQQGVQLLRVHDVAETSQAIALWRATVEGTYYG